MWDYGVHICERDEEIYRYVFRQMFSILFGLKYHREHSVINRIRALNSETQLEPFFGNIDISK